MAGRSRMRPLAATIETTLTVTGSARPDSRSSITCWRRLTGMCGSASVSRSSSLPSTILAKRNSSSSTSPSSSSARTIW